MLLLERIVGEAKIVESDRTKLPDGVLCRVKEPVCNVEKLNANNRKYGWDVVERVTNDKTLSEQIGKRALFGHAEHPATSQSNLELVSHVICEWVVDKDNNTVYQVFDVLDTPTGRIVDCLIRANCGVGVSTRAEGELTEEVDPSTKKKYHRVVAEKYKYITTDFTADPSTFGAMPIEVKRNVVESVKQAALCEKATEGDKKFAGAILESMLCKHSKNEKDGKCEQCGCCKAIKDATVRLVADPNQQMVNVSGDVGAVNVNPDSTGANPGGAVEVTVTANPPVPLAAPNPVPEPDDLEAKEDEEEAHKEHEESETPDEEEKEHEDEMGESKVNEKAEYVGEDGKTLVEHDVAGVWALEEASKVCLNTPGGVIIPESSEEWMVMVVPGSEDESKKDKSVGAILKEMNKLRVKNASLKAERDRLAGAVDEGANKDFQLKIAVSKLQEARKEEGTEVKALRAKIEEKAQMVANLESQVRTNAATAEKLVKENRGLMKKIDELTVGNEKILKENKQKIADVEKNGKKALDEQVNKAKADATRAIIKEYVAKQLKAFKSVQDNVRALLEDCKTIAEVDEALNEYRDSTRRNALHSNPPKEITVPKDDARKENIVGKRVRTVFEGMGR